MRRACIRLAAYAALAVAAHQAGADALLDSARRNDADAVLAAIEQGADVGAAAADGTTALHWAVYNDNAPLVGRLIAAGADVNAVNNYGASVMSEAATVANAAVIGQLLDAGADVESRGADGQTALMIVARTSRTDAAGVLLARGADVDARETWRGQTALMWAAAQRQPAMVRLLIEQGAGVDNRSTPNEWPRQVTGEPRRMYRPFAGLTPLLFAAREGCLDCARALVEAGANIDLADPKNVTPLFLAIDNLHFDLAKYLIEAGANPNKWDWWGRTPLYSAVDVNTLPHGGRPDRPSTDTTTGIEIVKGLLEAGANPNVQLKLYPPWRHIGDDRGCDSMLTIGATPLLRAAKTFDIAAMELLIQHGAKIELPNDGGITPLMAAAGYGSVECDPRGYGPGIPHYLTADVEEKSIKALTLLLDAERTSMHARRPRPRVRVVPGVRRSSARRSGVGTRSSKHLVSAGARIDVADASGLTPVDSARGKAGGHGRGQTIEVFEDTAQLLEQLCRDDSSCDLTKPAKAS